MIRELFISIYLFVFKFIFSIFSNFKTQNKTIFVASFKEDINLLNNQLKRHLPKSQRVILQNNNNLFKKHDTDILLDFSAKYPIKFIKSIYHLATASHIFLDNYYGFLAVVKFKSNVKRVQIWHANGAFKKFGLEDQSNHLRSHRAIKRFKKVYNNFTHIIVSSDKMANIFANSFGENSYRYLKTGMPRTDFYFSISQISYAKQRFFTEYNIPKDKKILLYAPTYRDSQLSKQEIYLDINKLRAKLSEQYTLLLRLHPSVQKSSTIKSDGFIIDVTHYAYLKDLLVVSDILITDYSSIPFEFGLLGKPMIFYTFDLKEYQTSRGLINNYMNEVPGPIVNNSSELVDIIINKCYDLNKVEDFATEWNIYSSGKATESIIHKLYT